MDLWAAVPAEVEGSCDLQYCRAETFGPVFALVLMLHPQANILEVTMAGVCSLVHTFALVEWNTNSPVHIVEKKFRWCWTCPSTAKPTSKTARYAANQSRSALR